MVAPYPIQGLKELAERHPLEQKWLIVPTQQDGAMLSIATARAGAKLLDVEPFTPRLLAEKLGMTALEAEGKRSLPQGFDRLLVEELLVSDQGELFPLDPNLTRKENPAIGDALSQSINTLRLAGTNPHTALQTARSGRARAVASALCAYERLLHDGHFFDDADLYRSAIEQASGANAVVGVVDEVQLDELPARLLEALRDHATAFYRIGLPCAPSAGDVIDLATGLSIPKTVAAYRFAEAPVLPELTRVHPAGQLYSEHNAELEDVHLMAAGSAADEARAVLDALRKQRIPLDDVEVAYVRRDPYLSFFLGYRGNEEDDEHLSLPITVAPGRPASATGPGAFIKGLLNWLAEGLTPVGLHQLVGAGLLRLDRTTNCSETMIRRELSEMHFGHGIRGHRRTLERRLEDDGTTSAITGILDLLPGTLTTPNEFAAAVRTILEQFGPVDAAALRLKQAQANPDDDPFTDDEFAHLQLTRQLDAQAIVKSDRTFEATKLAQLLTQTLLGTFGRAQHAKAGHLHVVPLENAGFSGRKHLFVVGLDSTALSHSPVGDAFVPHEDDEGDWAALGGTALPTGHPADLKLWQSMRALARCTGTITLSHPTFDAIENEPLEPASLFLRIQWRKNVETPIPFRITRGDERLATRGPLDAIERSILLGQVASANPKSDAQVQIRAEFPGTMRGLDGLRSKERLELTEFDGWIGGSDTIDLEGLALIGGSEPLSASRLQTLAECPHKYFLSYVLELKKPEDQPDENEWLDALKKGSFLHEVFFRFMESLPPATKLQPNHEDLLREVFERELAAQEERFPPPSAAVGRKVRNWLWNTTQAFFNAELHHNDSEAIAFELGFGLDEEKAQEHAIGHTRDHVGRLMLSLADITPFRVTGRVDRLDRFSNDPSGQSYGVWDYKTGSAGKYVSSADPLDDGRLLQPHLYAYAVKAAFGLDVVQTGYIFPNPKEGGLRVTNSTVSEDELARVIGDLAALPPAGFFVQAPSAANCKYCDFKEACGAYKERAAVIQPSAEAAREDADHPASDVLERWNYIKED